MRKPGFPQNGSLPTSRLLRRKQNPPQNRRHFLSASQYISQLLLLLMYCPECRKFASKMFGILKHSKLPCPGWNTIFLTRKPTLSNLIWPMNLSKQLESCSCSAFLQLLSSCCPIPLLSIVSIVLEDIANSKFKKYTQKHPK